MHPEESIDIRKIGLIIGLIIFAMGLVVRPLWEDEVEHLHCAYMMSQGSVPYVDFFQNHPPTLHIILAPFVRCAPRGLALIFGSRIVVTALLVVSLLTLRSLSLRRNRSWMYIALISAPVYWLNYHLRPDIFMILFLSFHLLFIFKWMDNLYPTRSAFLSGFFLGGAVTFLPKAGLIAVGYLLFLLIIARHENRRRPIIATLLGLGILPCILYAYLWFSRSVNEYLHSVFLLNIGSVTSEYWTYKIHTLVVNGAILLMWAASLYYQRNTILSKQEAMKKNLLILYSVMALVGFFTAPFGWQYNLAIWNIMIALYFGLTAGCFPAMKMSKFPALISLTVFMGMLLPPMYYVLNDLFQVNNSIWRYQQFCFISENSDEDRSVFAVAPFHPIKAMDACGIYHPWQFHFAKQDKTFREKWFNAWSTKLSDSPPVFIDAGYLTTAIAISTDPGQEHQQVQQFLNMIPYMEKQYKQRTYFILIND